MDPLTMYFCFWLNAYVTGVMQVADFQRRVSPVEGQVHRW